VPGSLAQSLNAGVGDTVRLSVAVQSGCAKYESYWAPSGFNHTDEYTIVGICNTQNELSGDIFIPKTGAIDFSPNHFSFTLGQVVLDNDTAYRFIADIEPSLPDRARVTVFDQGYTAVVRPMKDVMRVALIVTGICAAAGLAIAALFGFVFVYRQKDSAKIMRMLGAKKREIIGYYLYGSGCLSFFGSAIGIVIGILISEICMGLVRQFAFHYGADSFLYSSGSQSMIKAAEYQPGINVWVFAGTGFAVFLLAVLSCRIFAGMCLRSHNRKRRKYAFLKRARSSSLTGGPLKFSWLSVKRGCLRSFVPAAVCLCAVVLLNQLVYTAEGNKKKLSDLSRNTSTMGYLTDSKGHKIDGLNIGGAALNGLYSSDQLSDIHTSKRICYYYLSKASEMDEALDSLLPKIYATSFSFETFMNKLNSGPGLIYTNDFSSVPEFYYSTKITTNYLDGYDESLFTRDAGDTASCLVSESFMREQGIKAGDTIAVLILREEALGRQSVDTQELFVAGSYIKAGKDDNIYCQLDAYVSEFQLSDPGADADTLRQYTFSSASFTLKNSEGLSAFKAYLFEKGYSEVNTLRSIRSFVVLEDIAYLRTKSAMNRRIWYMDHAFPVIYVAILLFAGLIPFIFILLRKREIAIMRSMGASKTTACLSMFFEQVMLCIPGSMIGYIVLRIIHRVFNLFGFLLTCAFILCWLFGALLSIKNINRFAVQEILRVEE
jgi:ABC-type lipoprotein release transport system permease subunit